MATDPLTLLAQGNCYACFGTSGSLSIMELALVAQWADQSSTLNLIPVGATYDFMGHYSASVPVPHTYNWVKGANDFSITDFNGHLCSVTCTSLFVVPPLLTGVANSVITAQLFFVS